MSNESRTTFTFQIITRHGIKQKLLDRLLNNVVYVLDYLIWQYTLVNQLNYFFFIDIH